MSKILKSFGMAALLVALLAGTGMGQDNADATVTGCVVDSQMTITTDPDATVNMILIKNTAPTAADTIGLTVTSGPWKLQVEDLEGTLTKGYMYDTSDNPLDNAFQVNDMALTSTQTLYTGVAGCAEQVKDLTYKQTVSSDETAGTYSISIRYTLSSNPA